MWWVWFVLFVPISLSYNSRLHMELSPGRWPSLTFDITRRRIQIFWRSPKNRSPMSNSIQASRQIVLRCLARASYIWTWERTHKGKRARTLYPWLSTFRRDPNEPIDDCAGKSRANVWLTAASWNLLDINQLGNAGPKRLSSFDLSSHSILTGSNTNCLSLLTTAQFWSHLNAQLFLFNKLLIPRYYMCSRKVIWP